jgi:hypothetical protein
MEDDISEEYIGIVVLACEGSVRFMANDTVVPGDMLLGHS